MRLARILFVILLSLSTPAMAAGGHAGHGNHGGHHNAPPAGHTAHESGMPTMAGTARTAADRALYDVSKKMHHAMDVALVGTADADFIRTMIPHHQGAIDMAHVVLTQGQDARVRWLAQNITRAQIWEISWMNRLLVRMNQPAHVRTGGGAMAESADTEPKRALLAVHHHMHSAMDVALTGDADADFVRAMIPHHQGAIDMAYWVLTHGRNTDVQKLAREIIKAQTAEIAWMQGWLKNHATKAKKPCGCVHGKAKGK